jgi:hypothetical protein
MTVEGRDTDFTGHQKRKWRGEKQILRYARDDNERGRARYEFIAVGLECDEVAGCSCCKRFDTVTVRVEMAD